MNWRIVQQPNGLFGRFSEMLDTFSDTNLYEAAALKLCINDFDCTAAQALALVEAAKDAGSDGWGEALDRVRLIYGKAIAETTEFECSQTLLLDEAEVVLVPPAVTFLDDIVPPPITPPTNQFTIVATLEANDPLLTLDKVATTTDYLREQGWTVEEQGI